MANLWLKNILGQIPSTEKIEEERSLLLNDFKRFKQIEESSELNRYYELKEIVSSDGFKDRKKQIEALIYKGSEEERIILEFEKLQKEKELKLYFKTKDSDELKRYNEIADGRLLEKYNEVKTIVEGEELDQMKESVENEHQNELDKVKRFKALKRNADLKKYYKLIKSNDYKTYLDVKDSDLLDEYNALKTEVESFDYDQVNKKNKEEFKTQLENKTRFKQLTKNRNLKKYFRFTANNSHVFIDEIKQGQLLSEYEELKGYIDSGESAKRIEDTKFKNSDAFQLINEYKSLSKNPDIKFYFKYPRTKLFQVYRAVEESDKLKRFLELREEVNSEAFQKQVAYLKDAEKYKKTDDYSLQQEYNQLSRQDDIVWYLNELKQTRFSEITDWEIIFEEDFTNQQLNEEVWSPIVFSGLISLNQNFVTRGEKQFFTSGGNLEIDQSALQIITKKEQVQGKVWDTREGFTEGAFDFTSGTINTAQSFRFNKGRIEAKVMVQQPSSIIHGLSLKGDKVTPHIDLLKTGKGSGFEVRFIEEPSKKHLHVEKVKGLNIQDKFFIFRLDWTEEELIWYVNNVEVHRIAHRLNGRSLYINLASVLEKEPGQLPVIYSIDWIRVRKQKK